MSLNAIARRVKLAVEQDNTISVDAEDLEKSQGHSTEYLAFLGLKKTDLKTLESHGFAKRGYLHKTVKTKQGTRTENVVRWVLLSFGGSNDQSV